MPYGGRITGMKRIKIFALALLVSVLGTSAHAGDGKFSLLRCGLQWGGSTMEAKAYTAAKRNQKYDTQRALDSLDSNRPGAHTFVTTTSEKTGWGRLPRTFTLAKVGCSWR
jgi:hypothetical protein